MAMGPILGTGGLAVLLGSLAQIDIAARLIAGPFLVCDLILVALLIAFPILALYLPALIG